MYSVVAESTADIQINGEKRKTPAAHPVLSKPPSSEASLSPFFECLHISVPQIRMVLLKML